MVFELVRERNFVLSRLKGSLEERRLEDTPKWQDVEQRFQRRQRNLWETGERERERFYQGRKKRVISWELESFQRLWYPLRLFDTWLLHNLFPSIFWIRETSPFTRWFLMKLKARTLTKIVLGLTKRNGKRVANIKLES